MAPLAACSPSLEHTKIRSSRGPLCWAMARSPSPIGSISAPALVPSPPPTPTTTTNPPQASRSNVHTCLKKHGPPRAVPRPAGFASVRVCQEPVVHRNCRSPPSTRPLSLTMLGRSSPNQQSPTTSSRPLLTSPKASPAPARRVLAASAEARFLASQPGILSNGSGDPRIMSGPSQRRSCVFHREFPTFLALPPSQSSVSLSVPPAVTPGIAHVRPGHASPPTLTSPSQPAPHGNPHDACCLPCSPPAASCKSRPQSQ